MLFFFLSLPTLNRKVYFFCVCILQVLRALHGAGVTVLGGPAALRLGVVDKDKASPGFKTEYGVCMSVFVKLHVTGFLCFCCCVD